jgi:aryl carrier-like protein
MSVDASSATVRQVQVDVLSWLRDALEDQTVSADDNFLDIGGHSMMAIELNAWLSEKHGITVGLASLFRESIGTAIASSVPGN